MHWKAPSVRQIGRLVAELSNHVPTINKTRVELLPLWYGRHAMLGHAFDA